MTFNKKVPVPEATKAEQSEAGSSVLASPELLVSFWAHRASALLQQRFIQHRSPADAEDAALLQDASICMCAGLLARNPKYGSFLIYLIGADLKAETGMKTQMAEDGLHIFSLLSQGQAAEESNKKACMESLECTFAKRRWRDMQHMYSHIEAEMVAADSAMEVALCPGRVPYSQGSVVRGVFREVVDFLMYTPGSRTSVGTGLCQNRDAGNRQLANDAVKETEVRRGGRPEILVEGLLLRLPRFRGSLGPGLSSTTGVPELDARAQSFGAANSAVPTQSSKDAVSRNGFTPAVALRLQALLLETLLLLSAAVARPREPDEEQLEVRAAPYLSPGEELARPAAGAPAKNGKLKGSEAEAARAPGPKMPGAGDAALPLLGALQEVLQEEDQEEQVAPSTGPATNGTSAATPAGPVPHPDARELRVQAFLATLLNFIWLEPFAGLLPNPPKEVLQLVNRHPTQPDNADASLNKGAEVSRMYLASSELMPGLPSGYAGDEGAGSGEAASAGKALAKRALAVLLLLLFYDTKEYPDLAAAFATLADPRQSSAGDCAYAALAAPLHFPRLLRAILQKLQEPGYPILLYGLVVRTSSFRKFCASSPEKVLPAVLEALSALPAGESKATASTPPAASALLIVLLCLTGDRGFCEQCSVVHLEDARSVLGNSQRSIRDISLSSLLVVVLLRVAHWNFGACRDSFLNRAIAGTLGNLAGHGVEHVHWHAATRMLEVAGLLARNAVKAPTPARGAADEAELHRSRMVKALLRSLLRLVSSCLRGPRVTTNTQLVYALQKDYPSQFTQLEADPDMGPPLIHARTATDWFEAQCPPNDDGSVAVEEHLARLEEASSRLPSELMTLASVAGASVSAFAETEDVSAYFLPSIWRAALKLIPEHVCWSPAAAAKT
ncbi:Dym [Symbiodinium natans]|uniref:Dymeclin n=1 Tax=Symbiodinium natans TaxID=878477 RepID=A0A812ICI1_9DINO|nr:Dym [Symbiodinium natans]